MKMIPQGKIIQRVINFDSLVQFAEARREDYVTHRLVEPAFKDFTFLSTKRNSHLNKPFTLHEIGAELDVLLAQTHLCYNKPDNAADVLAIAISSNLF